MHKTLSALAIALCSLGACSNTVITHILGQDMGGPSLNKLDFSDGTTGQQDFSLPPGVKVGCNGFSTCMIGCFQDASATLAGCQTTCGKQATSTAPTKWSAAFSCGQGWCLNKNVPNGPTYQCMLDSTMTMLIGANCANCLNDSLAQLFGQACMNMSSADCNPSSCSSVQAACTNDLP